MKLGFSGELFVDSSAVPKCHPEGTTSDGVIITSGAFAPPGYTTTSFQLNSARLALVDAPAENPDAAAVARKSIFAVSEVAPAGTVR